MRHRVRGLAAAGALVLVCASAVRAPGLVGQELRGTLLEVVTGRGLGFGVVELISMDGRVEVRAISDEQGRFVATARVAGDYRVRAWRIDTDTVAGGPIELAAGQVRVLDVLLPVTAIELDPIEVTIGRVARLEAVGFYQRERLTTGVFMTRRQIDAGLRFTTVDVLARVSGVNVGSRLDGSYTVQMRAAMGAAARTGPCDPVIYINGAPVQQGGLGKKGDPPPPPLDLLTIPPDEIIGLEVYRSPAETPAQFSGGSAACGVIVIWLG